MKRTATTHRTCDADVVPNAAGRVRRLFEREGAARYGGEVVTQLEHALQTATRALEDVAPDALICAALLHDIGHLLDDSPDASSESRGKLRLDDRHDAVGARWLRREYPDEVVEPIRLHVEAKRYLCAVEPGYEDTLSPTSKHTLALQGGPMGTIERLAFERTPFASEAIQLRRWDDAAKVPGRDVQPLETFLRHVDAICARWSR